MRLLRACARRSAFPVRASHRVTCLVEPGTIGPCIRYSCWPLRQEGTAHFLRGRAGDGTGDLRTSAAAVARGDCSARCYRGCSEGLPSRPGHARSRPATSSSTASATRLRIPRRNQRRVPVFLDEYRPGGAPRPRRSRSRPPRVAPTSLSSRQRRADFRGALDALGNGEFLMAAGYDAASGLGPSTNRGDKTSTSPHGREHQRKRRNQHHDRADGLRQRKQPSQRRPAATARKSGSAAPERHNRRLSTHETRLLDVEPSSPKPTRTYGRSRSSNGQLYTSADPTKDLASPIATWAAGRRPRKDRRSPTCRSRQRPKSRTRYSLLTLGLGHDPRHDLRRRQRSRRGRQVRARGGKWVNEGSVEVPYVTGLTANDVSGVGDDLRHQQRLGRQCRDPLQDLRRQRRRRHAQRHPGGNRDGARRTRRSEAWHSRPGRRSARAARRPPAPTITPQKTRCPRRSATRRTKRSPITVEDTATRPKN